MKEKLAKEQEKLEQLQKQLEQNKANVLILTGAVQAKLETVALLQEEELEETSVEEKSEN